MRRYVSSERDRNKMILIDPISPIAFSVFDFGVRWYALAYIAAFVLGFFMLRGLLKSALNKKQYDDLFTALILGVIIGGRLGYVLFYNLPYFLVNPLEIFAVWHGGMSFHGGLIGVLCATFLFARKNKLSGWKITDALAVVAPIGLFFGRIANFVNMEVMGRATDMPWGVVFSGTNDLTPRHPSPLYEAGLEGILLFLIMFGLWRWTDLRGRAGMLSGAFAILYAIFRIFVEQFRAPDIQLGFLAGNWLTMGMLLSGIMFIIGAILIIRTIKK
jgi:phosphatidylglycerol:prolipoprotein diacylglycerol transferase